MSELISGKEALIALANGSVVQGNMGFGWIDIDLNDDILLNSFITERNRDGIAVKFRLKPKTITINGIEVPASSNFYSGGLIWILCGTDAREYTSLVLDENDEFPAYFWKSEEEIKQVVAALRKIFVINNQ